LVAGLGFSACGGTSSTPADALNGAHIVTLTGTDTATATLTASTSLTLTIQ
jgi:hypothetical protein